MSAWWMAPEWAPKEAMNFPRHTARSVVLSTPPSRKGPPNQHKPHDRLRIFVRNQAMEVTT